MHAERAVYAIARPSVHGYMRPSVTRVDQSKSVKVRIIQFLPHSSPPHSSSICRLRFMQKFWRVLFEQGRQTLRFVWGNKLFSSYRAMHFSAKRGIVIAFRLSVSLSVCNVGGL